jgi:KDO2-lipid IV(A) lauroyltransferase
MLTVWGLLCARALGRVVPHAALGRLAGLFAALAFVLLPRKRANIQRNLRILLRGNPDRGTPAFERRVRALAWRQMMSYGRVLMDFVLLPQIVSQVHEDTERAPGWEHIDAELAAGRGVVFVTAHFGSWDAAAAAVTKHFPPGTVYAVAEPFANPDLDTLVTRERTETGLGIVPMDDVRRMVRVLRAGHVLGVLVDRPVSSGDGVQVQMFGRPTALPAGAAALALMARCAIVPGYLRRRADGSFEGAILPKIEPVRTGNREADLAATMQLVANSLERIIRRSPHQWYMFRDMWPASEQASPALPAVAGSRPAARRLAASAAVFSALGGASVLGWLGRCLPVAWFGRRMID